MNWAKTSGIASSIEGLLAHLLAGGLGQRLRRADAGDDVLALGVDQELAVEAVLAGGGSRVKATPVAEVVAHVAEDHRLHVHGGAPAFGMSCMRR